MSVTNNTQRSKNILLNPEVIIDILKFPNLDVGLHEYDHESMSILGYATILANVDPARDEYRYAFYCEGVIGLTSFD
jgi:hypothetical protein